MSSLGRLGLDAVDFDDGGFLHASAADDHRVEDLGRVLPEVRLPVVRGGRGGMVEVAVPRALELGRAEAVEAVERRIERVVPDGARAARRDVAADEPFAVRGRGGYCRGP